LTFSTYHSLLQAVQHYLKASEADRLDPPKLKAAEQPPRQVHANPLVGNNKQRQQRPAQQACPQRRNKKRESVRQEPELNLNTSPSQKSRASPTYGGPHKTLIQRAETSRPTASSTEPAATAPTNTTHCAWNGNVSPKKESSANISAKRE